MKGADKTREQSIGELAYLRQRIAELETLEVERKRVEEALRESEKKYRQFIENTKEGLWAIGAEAFQFHSENVEVLVSFISKLSPAEHGVTVSETG